MSRKDIKGTTEGTDALWKECGINSESFNFTCKFDSQSCYENNLIAPLAPLGAVLEIILLESTVTEHSFTDS